MNELVSNMISEYPTAYSEAECDIQAIGYKKTGYGAQGESGRATGGGIRKK
jgi:hypothetical protein